MIFSAIIVIIYILIIMSSCAIESMVEERINFKLFEQQYLPHLIRLDLIGKLFKVGMLDYF